MTIRSTALFPAGTRPQYPRTIRGLGLATMPYDSGMELKARVNDAASAVLEQVRIARAMKDSPFLSRGNEEVLTGYITRGEALIAQLRLVSITEANRDTARMNYDETQILDMLSAADAIASTNPAGEMRGQVIRRAAIGGFAAMAAVVGGLVVLSRKKAR